jgi:hypothetical protein
MDDVREPAPENGIAPLLVAPGLIAIALVLYVTSDRLVEIGPFDRAKIGWAVVVPLLAVAPGAAALAGRSVGARRAAIAAGLISVVSGVGLAWWVSVATIFLDCREVTDPLVVLPRTLPIALVAAAAFGAAAAAAWQAAKRDRRLLAVLIGAAVWFAGAIAGIFVWVLSFPQARCLPSVPL